MGNSGDVKLVDDIKIREPTRDELKKLRWSRGWCDYEKGEIVIPSPEILYKITLYHELTHWERRNKLTAKIASAPHFFITLTFTLLSLSLLFPISCIFEVSALIFLVWFLSFYYEEKVATDRALRRLYDELQN